MCGRTLLLRNYADIRLEMQLRGRLLPNLRPSWNIAPSQELLCVILDDETRERIGVKMRWGLIPSWSKDSKPSFSTFNARAETIGRTASFRDAWKAGRRCLIVTDGFYEWRKKDRQPFAIARAHGRLTVMAGLWEERSGEGQTIRSCTLITTVANALLEPLHDRMPVILAEKDWPMWLGETPATEAELKALLVPYSAEEMKLWPVDKRVGNVRNDDEDLIREIPLAELAVTENLQQELF